MQLQTLQDLFEHEVSDLYSAETQLVTALPKMEKAAQHDELKMAFKEHLEETKGHLQRSQPGACSAAASTKRPCDRRQRQSGPGALTAAGAAQRSARLAPTRTAGVRLRGPSDGC